MAVAVLELDAQAPDMAVDDVVVHFIRAKMAGLDVAADAPSEPWEDEHGLTPEMRAA